MPIKREYATIFTVQVTLLTVQGAGRFRSFATPLRARVKRFSDTVTRVRRTPPIIFTTREESSATGFSIALVDSDSGGVGLLL